MTITPLRTDQHWYDTHRSMVLMFASKAQRDFRTMLRSMTLSDIENSIWAYALPRLRKWDPAKGAAESTFLWNICGHAVIDLTARVQYRNDLHTFMPGTDNYNSPLVIGSVDDDTDTVEYEAMVSVIADADTRAFMLLLLQGEKKETAARLIGVSKSAIPRMIAQARKDMGY